MKIRISPEDKIIMQNGENIHGYFGWPTVAKLKDKIAVVASGYRLAHVCPFGKTVISFSFDNGESFTPPAPVIDTCLDDRDGGLCAFGNNGVFVSSFNNTVEMQKSYMRDFSAYHTGGKAFDNYKNAYLDLISENDEKEAIGANFRISHNGGVLFGKIMKSPVSSPHGPVQIDKDRLLWVGRSFMQDDIYGTDRSKLQAYYVDFSGNMSLAGEIEAIITENGKTALSCEPHAVVCKSGKAVCHIRVQWQESEKQIMTLYQTESYDSGKTWTKPHRVTEGDASGPAHLMLHSSGALICSYGIRNGSFGAGVMFSFDEGKTWQNDTVIYDNNGISSDIGYPSTVELDNNEMLTVFYAHIDNGKNAIILGKKWSVEF